MDNDIRNSHTWIIMEYAWSTIQTGLLRVRDQDLDKIATDIDNFVDFFYQNLQIDCPDIMTQCLDKDIIKQFLIENAFAEA